MVLLPNSVYGSSASGGGSHFALLGLPTYANRTAAVAAGMTTGQVYWSSTVGPADNFTLCMV